MQRTPRELQGNPEGTPREALQNPEKNPTESQRIDLTSTLHTDPPILYIV
jgi:hypothetical protein